MMTEAIIKPSVEDIKLKRFKAMIYETKITDVKKEFSLPDNAKYLDVWFDVLLDGKVIAQRRMSFPMDTPSEDIAETVKRYAEMYENDHLLAEEAAKRSESEKAADETIEKLTGKSL